MLNVVKQDDSAGVDLCFILDVTWLNETYRFSTFEVTIFDGNNPYYYHGSLGEIEFVQTLERDINVDGDSIPIEIIFIDKDLVKLRLEGHTLDYADCKLYYVTVRHGVVLQDYDNRIPIAAGVVVEPMFGEIDMPAGYVTFSIENGLDVESTPLLRADDVINQGQGHGKYRPIIIGRPCGLVAIDDGNDVDSFPASPAYLYPHSPENRIHIAAHPVTATSVKVTDQDGTEVNRTVYNRPNLAYVTSTGLAIDDNAVTRIFVRWDTAGGGLRNPSTGEAVNGAGDLLKYMLQLTNYPVDGDALDGIREYLNTWQFDGFINDEIDALEFVENNMVGVLPFFVHNGPKGIRPILDLFNAITIQSSIVTIQDGPDFRIISGLIPMGNTGDLCNNLIFRCAYSLEKEAYLMTINIDPRVDLNNTTAMTFSTVYADSSFNRYGLKTKIIEHDFIGDYTTACALAKDYVRRHAYLPIKLEVEANVAWGWLDLGDIIDLNSDRLHLSNHKAQVISKTWSGSGWRYQLRIDDSGLQNSRPTQSQAPTQTVSPDPDSNGDYDTSTWFYRAGNSSVVNDSGYKPRLPFDPVDGINAPIFTFWGGAVGINVFLAYGVALSGAVNIKFKILHGGGGHTLPTYNVRLANNFGSRVFSLGNYDWLPGQTVQIQKSSDGYDDSGTWTTIKTITKSDITNTQWTEIDETFTLSNEYIRIQSLVSTTYGWALVNVSITN